MKKIILTVVSIIFCQISSAQEHQDFYQPKKTTFWSDVQIGGGLGLGFGNGFSNIAVSPSAIKPIPEQLYLVAGLQFNYLKSKDFFESTSYGASIIGLYNPAPIIHLSAELEQLRVNNILYDHPYNSHLKESFWNTALFLGAGYTSGNATIGIRYNVLFKENNFVYNQAWMPFIRVYF